MEEPRLMKRLKQGEPSNKNCDLLYGYSVVLPALESKRRVPYRLFYRGESETTKKEDSDKLDKILGLAEELQLPIQKMDRKELNDYTGNRPHQGVVLKTDRLEPHTINRLSAVEGKSYHAVSGSGEYLFESKQSPIWLALDQVVDPQNLGAILRSAYYFGIDGVVFCARNSAPLTPVVSKASSGALEVMDVYSVKNMMKFLRESQENGWTVIGASAERTSDGQRSIDPVAMSMIDRPRILVMGNEGFGLRKLVSENCQIHVSIPSTNPTIAPFLDSLNVSVATGVLLHMLTANRKPASIDA
ncbi:RNA methyltransferase [Basidiobolus meristosporus CBS 931.73]|uniref:rRNA methyltransferase 1, mitochondrial n=1 Tax=Basidiobolus meristosporus CBS 931.73 TaxID=1314790 RepID=A0A1Y1ZCL0_9FUNG|nr:RNA methyltransferase [Basidiobolus meristosporus CBS 931.73]|eukprot:ORY08013.1 RNA methyltransferase [Basidiobolus meristosporus CBS 931.73]